MGGIPRGYADRGTAVAAGRPTVAEWGKWHGGEDKARSDATWTAEAPTLFEGFVEREAVRIVLVGDRAWQVRMAGEGWLKLIHDPGATLMPIGPELLDDARRLADHLGLRTEGVDDIDRELGLNPLNEGRAAGHLAARLGLWCGTARAARSRWASAGGTWRGIGPRRLAGRGGRDAPWGRSC